MDELDLTRRSWIEIDLEQIKTNYLVYKSCVSNEVMAVVKSDAYGHGAVAVAKLMQECGVTNFAVSNISEAIELRENGVKGLILVLGYTPIESIELVKRYNITQTLLSEKYAEDVIATGKKIRCHYAIDTGMNRIGLCADNIDHCIALINRAHDMLELTGIFTHFCVADSPEQNEFTNIQIERFRRIVQGIKQLNLPEIHCCNSAGGLWHQNDISCFSRLGIILYGLKPNYHNVLPRGINPAMTWKSVISMIKNVSPGDTIGYGRTFEAKRVMRIGTIPTGYADGYDRRLSNCGFVLVHGKKAPIVGRICMNQFMIDLTDILEAKEYDEVILMGDGFTPDDMAKMLDTIGHEIVCDVGKRVERAYIGK